MPAARHIVPPAPGRSSRLWMVEPVGKSRNTLVIPALTGASARELMVSPAPIPAGARIYRWLRASQSGWRDVAAQVDTTWKVQ